METKRKKVSIKIFNERDKNPSMSYSIITKLCNTNKSNVYKIIQRYNCDNLTKSRPEAERSKDPAERSWRPKSWKRWPPRGPRQYMMQEKARDI